MFCIKIIISFNFCLAVAAVPLLRCSIEGIQLSVFQLSGESRAEFFGSISWRYLDRLQRKVEQVEPLRRTETDRSVTVDRLSFI